MSDGRLARRVAIVTGGAGGIGGATARRLSAEGAHTPLRRAGTPDEVAAIDPRM